jgi:transcription elongation factor GreB
VAKTNYITPEGLAKLREEVDHLWKVERPRVTAEVEAAAALGDRSENAEYIYGKKRLREIDSRLRYLGKKMESLRVVESTPTGDGRATFGAWVTLEDEDGNGACYRLVGPDESDADTGMISIESPMGRALLGRMAGDAVEVQRPRGTACFEVLSVDLEDPR